MVERALEGIKIVDFCTAAAGPLAMKHLADHGATVIHVETSTAIDIARLSPPFKDNIIGVDRSGWWIEYNSSKLGMTLNLNHPKMLDVVRRLVSWADIVASGFSPGRMEKWGLGYDDLRKMKPEIIMYMTCNQGQTGPQAKRVGYGVQLSAHAGFTHLVGWPDRGPCEAYGAVTDWMNAIMSVAAVAAALDYRRRTGVGQLVDVSQLETAEFFLAPLLLDYSVNGRVASRRGNRSDRAAPHGAYRCLGDDRWCAIAVYNDQEWDSFCDIIGNPPWTKDARFATNRERLNNTAELDQLVEEWTKERRSEDVMMVLQEAGVPAGLIEDARDMHDDPQLKHRGHFVELEHSEMGKVAHSRLGFRLSETPDELKAAHCLGEHNEYICTQILGMTDDEYLQLLAEGVLE
ncbi:CaiB/BaiF CoA transferase family protein [Chloroflexota bacterium]